MGDQTDRTGNVASASIRATMSEGGFQSVKDFRVWPAVVAHYHSGNSAHDHLPHQRFHRRPRSCVVPGIAVDEIQLKRALVVTSIRTCLETLNIRTLGSSRPHWTNGTTKLQ